MQVIDGHTFYAWCRDSQGERRRIDTALLGRQAEGNWLLVFMGVAREVLDADNAAMMSDALEALSRVMAGETEVDDLFPDLVGREPPLPEHLRHLVDTQDKDSGY
jgi:hydrogenase expression/formation protein HypC